MIIFLTILEFPYLDQWPIGLFLFLSQDKTVVNNKRISVNPAKEL